MENYLTEEEVWDYDIDFEKFIEYINGIDEATIIENGKTLYRESDVVRFSRR